MGCTRSHRVTARPAAPPPAHAKTTECGGARPAAALPVKLMYAGAATPEKFPHVTEYSLPARSRAHERPHPMMPEEPCCEEGGGCAARRAGGCGGRVLCRAPAA